MSGWTPQPGSQRQFLSCPAFEVLIEGTRGGGKTDALLMDFAQHVGQGFGREWRGILFRRTYPQLADVIHKTMKWFPEIFPEAVYNRGEHRWIFRDGEELLLRHFDKPDDYWNYHGHSYPWIGWEELTNWPTLDGYETMLTCCRSSAPRMPRKVRATANPFGVGHNAVKARFITPAPPLTPFGEDPEHLRVRVHSTIWENQALLEADPGYTRKLETISDENRRKAWFLGSWDITAGGMFDDLWSSERHIVEPFQIPETWYVDRSFDWGSAAPFAVIWWAESNGETVKTADGREIATPRGTLFAIAEWYGADAEGRGLHMTAAQIAEGIRKREAEMRSEGKIRRQPRPGPADSAIFAKLDGPSIGETMRRAGIEWTASVKGAGSRVNGWEAIRDRLAAALDRPMERPGLFVFRECQELISHLPTLPRDERNPADVASAAVDHDADAVRYRLMDRRTETGTAEAPW